MANLHGPSFADRLLDALVRASGDRAVADLSAQFGRRPSNVIDSLKRLEARGLVEKVEDRPKYSTWRATDFARGRT